MNSQEVKQSHKDLEKSTSIPKQFGFDELQIKVEPVVRSDSGKIASIGHQGDAINEFSLSLELKKPEWKSKTVPESEKDRTVRVKLRLESQYVSTLNAYWAKLKKAGISMKELSLDERTEFILKMAKDKRKPYDELDLSVEFVLPEKFESKKTYKQSSNFFWRGKGWNRPLREHSFYRVRIKMNEVDEKLSVKPLLLLTTGRPPFRKNAAAQREVIKWVGMLGLINDDTHSFLNRLVTDHEKAQFESFKNRVRQK